MVCGPSVSILCGAVKGLRRRVTLSLLEPRAVFEAMLRAAPHRFGGLLIKGSVAYRSLVLTREKRAATPLPSESGLDPTTTNYFLVLAKQMHPGDFNSNRVHPRSKNGNRVHLGSKNSNRVHLRPNNSNQVHLDD